MCQSKAVPNVVRRRALENGGRPFEFEFVAIGARQKEKPFQTLGLKGFLFLNLVAEEGLEPPTPGL